MADYRSVKVQMWRSDEWFQALLIDARLFWIYLFTNPSARVAGIYKLTARTMSFETGIDANRIEELKTQFSQAGKAYFEKDVVWVVKMRELQSPGRISAKLQTGIDNDVAEIPNCELKRQYMIRYAYPIDTLSEPENTVCIPFPTTQHISLTPNGAASAASSNGSDPLASPLQAPSEGMEKDPSALQECLKALRSSGANKGAAIGKLYVARFGSLHPPNYGRLGKIAKDLSGDYITLAHLISDSSMPAGDPHDYLEKTAQSSKARHASQDAASQVHKVVT
jgi:hypothetical protein